GLSLKACSTRPQQTTAIRSFLTVQAGLCSIYEVGVSTKMTTNSYGLKLWMVAALVLSASGTALAQSVGGAQISGVITDPTGAVVPSVQVKAIQTDTGQVRTTVSTSNGSYALPGLSVGPYRLEVSSQGFERYVNSGIVLEVGNQVQLNVTLRLGDTTQEVRVTADAAMVQTQDTAISEVINQRRI